WGRTISVIPACGGAGGTTVSCYLATALAEAAKSTAAVIDLDLEFGTVASMWDITPRYTVADIASAGTVDKMLIEDAMIDLPCSVGILPRPIQIEQAHSVHDAIVRNLIEATRQLYPYVILDLPRKMDAIAGTAIQASDKLLIVVELTVASVDNAARLTD